ATAKDGATRDTPHRLVVFAVDDRGARSAAVSIGLGADNIPPSVHITCPQPDPHHTLVPGAVRIDWEGTDPDGSTGRPALYKYVLLSPSSEFPERLARTNPDSLRRYFANHPAGPWAGWDSTSAESTHVELRNLAIGSPCLFVVVAFDEAGDYSPTFDLNTNMLGMLSEPSHDAKPRFILQG